MTLFIIGLIVVIGSFIFLYNSLIRYSLLVKEAWSDIDVQLKKRHDLIPNIVEVVKNYSKYEQSTFEKITHLRSEVINSSDAKVRSELENDISRSLKSIFALAENYPELKASESFLNLQHTLSGVEDDIQMSRRYYNGTVRDYNVAIATLPGNIVANFFNFKPAGFFELEYATERNSPDIKFDK